MNRFGNGFVTALGAVFGVISALVLFAAVVGVVAVVAFDQAVPAQAHEYQVGGKNPDAGEHVTICHATGSAKTPYVQISPSIKGVLNAHAMHQEDKVVPVPGIGELAGDIIPPFHFHVNVGSKAPEYEGRQFEGRNWHDLGQLIYDNDCELIERDPITDPDPDPDPDPGTDPDPGPGTDPKTDGPGPGPGPVPVPTPDVPANPAPDAPIVAEPPAATYVIDTADDAAVLPYTGASIIVFVVIGVVLAGLGALLWGKK